MKMAELVKMLRQRQESEQMSIEEYANQIGIRGSTLSRYYNLERNIRIDVVRRMARYYQDRGDQEMLAALTSYALDLNGSASSPR